MRADQIANKNTTLDIQKDISTLLAIEDSSERESWIKTHLAPYGEEDINGLMQALKETALAALRGDNSSVDVIAETILAIAEITGLSLHEGLGLRIKAQVLAIGKGNHNEALPFFDSALSVYQAEGDKVREALVQMTRIVTLMNLGKDEEALRAGKWAERTFEENGEWRYLGVLRNNLAMLFNRGGDQKNALQMYDLARDAFQALGKEGRVELPNVEQNRVVALHFMGRHEEAIKVGQAAIKLGAELDQHTVIARTKHIMGSAYRALGNHTLALKFLADAKKLYTAFDQPHQAALSDLTSAEVLIEIRQFKKASTNCEKSRKVFRFLGMKLDEAGALLGLAFAQTGLGNLPFALQSLEEALTLYLKQENQYFAAYTELAIAAVELKQGDSAKSLARAKGSLDSFISLDMPVEASYAQLAMAKANLALGHFTKAIGLADNALKSSQSLNMPHLQFQCHAVLGDLAISVGKIKKAKEQYSYAIDAIEAWGAHVISEFQGAFLEDKVEIYEKLIKLLVEDDDQLNAFSYVERAKSRALSDLLSGKGDLKIRARKTADRSTVGNINSLIQERRELLHQQNRQLEKGAVPTRAEDDKLISDMEIQITDQWHDLIIENHEYGRQFSPWDLHDDAILPLLDVDTALIEYFSIEDEYYAFVASKGTEEKVSVQNIPLSCSRDEILRLIQSLRLNIETAAHSSVEKIAQLEGNAKALLEKLHSLLIGPIETLIYDYASLIFVPYKVLHYLPFHALFDGTEFLVEKYELAYLPNASSLNYLSSGEKREGSALVIGHSHFGRLRFSPKEAEEIAKVLEAKLLLEENATLDAFIQLAKDASLVHFAGHGEFRADNPLFSGLAFEDGLLSTLDIFNLQLDASLVTLSACDTGRTSVGGGDELYGLMRAFLSSGADGLVLSQWQVADQSTKELMVLFYKQLAEGQSRSGALCQAQRKMIGDKEQSHPYYWAPFYFVGSAGSMKSRKTREPAVNES